MVIMASDNDPRIHFYCIDYNEDTGGGANWQEGMCYPSLREYDNIYDFYKDHPDAADNFKDVDIEDIHFYSCDYAEASLGFDIEDMFCADEDEDYWMHMC